MAKAVSGHLSRNAAKFLEKIVRVNEVPTHILTYGGWIKDPIMESCSHIVLVLPGNPGVIEFYKEFMKSIYYGLGEAIPVWGISHAGHVNVPTNYSVPPFHGNEHLYDLPGQIKHKIQFIEHFVPAGVSVILVGHSIGCYMALEVMNSIVGSQVAKSILLFPTVENIALSPQGRWAKPLLNYFQSVALAVLHILNYLSSRMQFKLLQWYFQGKNIADCCLTASLNIFSPGCAKNCMALGQQEMATVREADYDNIGRHLNDLLFYYGANDHWCLPTFYQTMKERFPTGRILMCDRGYDHAFVLESSREVGSMVANWVREMMVEN